MYERQPYEPGSQRQRIAARSDTGGSESDFRQGQRPTRLVHCLPSGDLFHFDSLGFCVNKTNAHCVAESSQAYRPKDDDLIDALSMHYRVHESKVIEWLLGMDLAAASKRMATNL